LVDVFDGVAVEPVPDEVPVELPEPLDMVLSLVPVAVPELVPTPVSVPVPAVPVSRLQAASKAEQANYAITFFIEFAPLVKRCLLRTGQIALLAAAFNQGEA
jgi:hypothetical protein